MKDLLDVHTHSIASIHAYSTLREMVTAAKEKGLALLGLAEHAPALPGAIHEMYFVNFKVVRPEKLGIDVVMGAELNIIDYSGSTDLQEKFLRRLDYAIASLHEQCIDPGTAEENTAALIGAMTNPKVKIIGHPDNPRFPVDYDKLARAAKERDILLEVNDSSYRSTNSRKGSKETSQIMLAACKKYGTAVIMGSDAHIDYDVGEHSLSLEMIRKADFPEELVINSDPARFKKLIGKE